MRLLFEDCVFDSDTREVSRGGKLLPVSPKAFDLLELLIRDRPKALSKERIHAKLWPRLFVSDASLSNLVAELRSLLGDDSRRPRLLRTVHRFGYAFIGDAGSRSGAAAVGERAALRLLWEGREIELLPGANVFGRDHDAAVWVDDASVSRRHARIVVGADDAILEDLGSKNGTLLNGEAIQAPTKLSDGDEIRIGRAAVTFRVLKQAGSTQTITGLDPRSSRKKSR